MSRVSRTDVARAAAAILRDGRAATLAEAIRLAAERAGVHTGSVAIADVREHVRAMALEALGDVGYRGHVADVLGKAEEAMTLLTTLPSEPRSVLLGRAARGEVDGDPMCRIRVFTNVDVGDIAALFVSAGYDEPSFDTVESRFGRLSQIVMVDDNVELRVTRCPIAADVPSDADLRTGARVTALTLDALRRMITELRVAGTGSVDRDAGS
ncbi:MAG: hypothetical protein SGJ09_11025 [Phycisphaerae bacterium]|nr:hypothetical protein [Phycisphaerae bacterium]